MPDDESALALLGRTGPLAVSSATPDSPPPRPPMKRRRCSATTSISTSTGSAIGNVLDIIDLSGDVPVPARGPITAEELREIVPELIDLDG